MAVILPSAVVAMVWCRDSLRGLTPGSNAVSHQAQFNRLGARCMRLVRQRWEQ